MKPAPSIVCSQYLGIPEFLEPVFHGEGVLAIMKGRLAYGIMAVATLMGLTGIVRRIICTC